MTVRSGRRCCALLKKQDPLGCLARTFLESSRWNSTTCYLTWKASATPRGRLLFRLAPWTQSIDETDSGLLDDTFPTPRSADGDKGVRIPEGYAKERERRGNGVDLPRAVAYPTPQAGANNKAAHGAMSGDFKTKFCEALGIPVTGSLNPQFVEWLMGYEIEWTALGHS